MEERLRAVLAAEPTVRWAYLFGSAARGEAFRDLDVGLVLTDDAKGAVAIGSIVSRLEEALPGYAIDVTDLASASPMLAGRVVREGRLLIDREPEARRDWEVEANSRALDIEPWIAGFERLRRLASRSRR